MELELRGKIALVTGGSRGIGRAVALSLAREGCAVGVCARDPAGLAAFAAAAEPTGSTVFTSATDVTRPGGPEQFVDDAAAALGGVDLLVANVGGSAGGSLLDSDPADWTRTFELNVGHTARAIRAAVPHMRRRAGGSIVIIGSISGSKPSPRAQYGAAKAAQIYLAGALAHEFGPDNIRVNTLSPGSILFPGGGWESLQRDRPDDFDTFRSENFPARRLGGVDEVADVVTFLLSDRARWINGAHIPVDGAQLKPSSRGY